MEHFYLVFFTCIVLVGFFILNRYIMLEDLSRDEKNQILKAMINEVYNFSSRSMSEILLPYTVSPKVKLILSSRNQNIVYFRLLTNKKIQFVKILKKTYLPILSDEITLTLQHDNVVKFYKIEREKVQRKVNDKSNRNEIENEDTGDLFNLLGRELILYYMEFLDLEVSYYSTFQNEKLVIKILYDVLKGLYFIHRKQIIHGNLTLKNIRGIVRNKTTVFKILNFDMSRALYENEVFIRNAYVGSLLFRAPEIFESFFLTQKADIYSFGAIGHYLLNDIENDYKKIKLCIKLNKCKECKRRAKYAVFQKCQTCLIQCLCHECRNCDLCSECQTCDICVKCLNCSECNLCAKCKKAAKNCMSSERIANRLPKIVNCKNNYLQKLISQCLSIYENRPGIKVLLNDGNTRLLFAEHWKNEDFPEYQYL